MCVRDRACAALCFVYAIDVPRPAFCNLVTCAGQNSGEFESLEMILGVSETSDECPER